MKESTKIGLKNAASIAFFGFLWVGAMIFLMYTHAFLHEDIHVLIYKDYGVSSTVEFEPFWTSSNALAYTYPNMSEIDKCNETCNFLQDMNEIEGYNAAFLGTTFVFVGGLWFMLWYFLRLRDKDYRELISEVERIKLESKDLRAKKENV